MSRWSKKDYEMVAAKIKADGITPDYFETCSPGTWETTLQRLALRFADTFAEDSKKFNRALFLKACGVTE